MPASEPDQPKPSRERFRVTVAIPTFRRPEGLALAVRSVFAQKDVEEFAIVVVDNDPAASAQEAFDRLSSEAPDHIDLTFHTEPNPGVANARNRLVEAASTPLIAFLDDDQTAEPNWLSSLLSTHEAFPSAAIFGPVRTSLPDSVEHHQEYLSEFFVRAGGEESGKIEESYGCGNCLLDTQRLPDIHPLFEVEMNETGGEDDHLFRAIRQSGGKFAWAAEAIVYEHVPKARANLAYTMRRAAAFGSSPVLEALTETPPHYHRALFWMGVGGIQFSLHGLTYILQVVAQRPNRAFTRDKAARGWGKIYWWKKREFYGRSAYEA